jgi:hypothetical protein
MEPEARVSVDLLSGAGMSIPARYAFRPLRSISSMDAHSKKTVDVQAYVKQHFRIRGGFALGRPVSVFGLINDGIQYFSK